MQAIQNPKRIYQLPNGIVGAFARGERLIDLDEFRA